MTSPTPIPLHPGELAALTGLDLAHFRQSMPAASCDEVRIITMHKLRYEQSEIDPQLRHESRAWLESRGYSRHPAFGPWPPKGKLP